MPKRAETFRGRKRDQARGTKQQRGYGGEWERISRIYRQSHPVCEVCHVAASDDCDHIIPFRGLNDPLRTAWGNLQAICRACHNQKTHGQG